MCLGVPTGIAGNLIGGVGHEGHLMGLHVQHQTYEVGTGIAFDIELGAQDAAQGIHVSLADMAFVGAGMYGNSISAEGLTILGHALHIGVIAASCIAQSGNFVYIYT
jgi:hypothetical protein